MKLAMDIGIDAFSLNIGKQEIVAPRAATDLFR
jgi:hypothetical protein